MDWLSEMLTARSGGLVTLPEECGNSVTIRENLGYKMLKKPRRERSLGSAEQRGLSEHLNRAEGNGGGGGEKDGYMYACPCVEVRTEQNSFIAPHFIA